MKALIALAILNFIFMMVSTYSSFAPCGSSVRLVDGRRMSMVSASVSGVWMWIAQNREKVQKIYTVLKMRTSRPRGQARFPEFRVWLNKGPWYQGLNAGRGYSGGASNRIQT